ncbi:hypothetical protein FKM82_000558 [Ascaphus truei]
MKTCRLNVTVSTHPHSNPIRLKSKTNCILIRRKQSTRSTNLLVCTNLNDLRELMKKIEGELKDLESNKKKSEKWYFRRQGVKELHSTLIRLLKELLPWEPKLLKAFQRNRARLKKDYDDFKRQPDHENFTREAWSHEECDAKSPNSIASTYDLYHKEILTKDYLEELTLSEMDVSSGKGKLPKKESFCRDLLKTPTKTCKRQCRQHISPDNEAKEISPRKKVKLSTHEAPAQGMVGGPRTCCSMSDHKQTESVPSVVMADSTATSLAGFVIGTKPIQALLAKNIGNKVTLTNQLTPTMSKNVPTSETSALSPTKSVPVKPLMSCQAATQTPLQMIYKLPDGQCIPIDLQNSSVKIQMQPVIDSKTGEKLMQQVLIFPKNLLFQHKEVKTTTKECQPLQQNTVAQHCVSNVISSSSKGYVSADTSAPLPAQVYDKSVVHLTKPIAVSQPSFSTSAGNELASAFKENQCNTSKGNTPVLATSFPGSLVPSVVSLAVPFAPGGATQGRATSTVAHHKVTSSLSNSSEIKQELKTVCIRDSQSILVRTRGGNTGVVKVQTSQDQISSGILPSSIFTFTPQLQPFLMSKSKTSISSTFSSVAPSPAAPPSLPFFQSPPSGFSPASSSVSGGLSQLTETNNNRTLGHPPSSGIMCPVADKSMQPSNFLSAISSTSSWLPSSHNNSHGTINVTAGSVSTSSSGNVGQAATDMKQTETKINKIPMVQPDSTTPSMSDFISGPSLHKVMLMATPPTIFSPGSTAKINMLATPTSSAVTSQKLVFINAQVPTGLSSNSLALQATKQAIPSVIGKTYVKTADQPPIVLIPSTTGSPMKMSSAPIVSQIKDVKIGLTIGQTIVNNSGATKNILPINFLRNTLAKGDDHARKGFAMPLATNFIPGIQNGCLGACTKVGDDLTVSTSKGTVGCASVASVCSYGAQSNTMDRNGNDVSRIVPALSNRLCSTNVGNTVAITTVKTGHLSSSVLLSTTPVTGCALSSLQMPITPTLPAPGVASHLVSSATVGSCQPVSKGVTEKVQFSSSRFPIALAANSTKPQAVLNHPLGTAVSKSGPAYGCSQGSSPAVQTASTANQLRGHLNDSCIQQKIVINNSTPLAPGTQITINGTRFIIPPQGLGAGSHVLLISTNAKQGLSSVGNSVQMCQGPPLISTTAQQTPIKQNMSSTQPLNHPFSISKTMNSFGTTNVNSKAFSPCPVTSVDGSSLTCSLSTAAPKTLVVPAVQSSSFPQPSNTAHFSRDMSVNRLLVTPEGGIVNAVNYPANKALLSPPMSSQNKNADTVFPAYQSSMPDKPNTVAL